MAEEITFKIRRVAVQKFIVVVEMPDGEHWISRPYATQSTAQNMAASLVQKCRETIPVKAVHWTN
jgi:hypothetical protein